MRISRKSIFRGCIETASIVFLFYANLLMGEFTVRNGAGKSWEAAFANILTGKNFAIAVVSAAIGFLCFEMLRKRL
jgi:hypothetical protein